MDLPIPIVKIIANYTGHPWRLRVCRKWIKIVDINIPSNLIIDTDDHYFHKSRIIYITSPQQVYERFCKSGCKIPKGFLILWTIDDILSMNVESGKVACFDDYLTREGRFSCFSVLMSHESKIYYTLKEMREVFD